MINTITIRDAFTPIAHWAQTSRYSRQLEFTYKKMIVDALVGMGVSASVAAKVYDTAKEMNARDNRGSNAVMNFVHVSYIYGAMKKHNLAEEYQLFESKMSEIDATIRDFFAGMKKKEAGKYVDELSLVVSKEHKVPQAQAKKLVQEWINGNLKEETVLDTVKKIREKQATSITERYKDGDHIGKFVESSQNIIWLIFPVESGDAWGKKIGATHMIHPWDKVTSAKAPGGGDYFRYAKIKKTVVEVAVDEDDSGNAVWEKWNVRKMEMFK